MANDVEYLINMLYEMVEGAKSVLMSPDKCTIVRDEALERTICQQLRNCMALHDAPAEQYERLGL